MSFFLFSPTFEIWLGSYCFAEISKEDKIEEYFAEKQNKTECLC